MWNIIESVAQGRSHIKAGTPCQDQTFSIHAKDVYVVSLADGAGSAKLSHFGAKAVTHFISNELSKKFDDYYNNSDGIFVKNKLLKEINEVLITESKKLECEIKELSSTLLVVAIKNNDFILAHIGDGVIGYLKDNKLNIASKPENGEYVNTTVFTTSSQAIATMKLIKGKLNTITGFVLMSDGPESCLYNKRTNELADILKKIMLLSSMIPVEILQDKVDDSLKNVIVNTTMDDCSLAFIMRENLAFKGYLKLSDKERRVLLGLRYNTPNKILKRYTTILKFLEDGSSLGKIAHEIYLKQKYAYRYVKRLCELNFVINENNVYRTILYMDKSLVVKFD